MTRDTLRTSCRCLLATLALVTAGCHATPPPHTGGPGHVLGRWAPLPRTSPVPKCRRQPFRQPCYGYRPTCWSSWPCDWNAPMTQPAPAREETAAPLPPIPEDVLPIQKPRLTPAGPPPPPELVPLPEDPYKVVEPASPPLAPLPDAMP